MQEMGGLPEQWRMDEAAVAVRRRMYRGPTPRERERWHWVRLLAQGGTAAGVGRTRERGAPTIAQWARAFAEGEPKAPVLNRAVVPLRVGRGAARRAEKGGAGEACSVGPRTNQLELAGGGAIGGGSFGIDAAPEQLSELSASVGVGAKVSH